MGQFAQGTPRMTVPVGNCSCKVRPPSASNAVSEPLSDKPYSDCMLLHCVLLCRYFTGIQNVHVLPNNCGYVQVRFGTSQHMVLLHARAVLVWVVYHLFPPWPTNLHRILTITNHVGATQPPLNGAVATAAPC
jgi:hypothetical protein